MLRSYTRRLALLSTLLLTTLTASASFVNYSTPGTIDTTIFSTLVDFNDLPPDPQFPDFGTRVSSVDPVQLFDDGTFTVNLSVPNFDDSALGSVRYGNRTHPGQTQGAANPFISSDSGQDDLSANRLQEIDFAIGGELVSAIGIQISTMNIAFIQATTPITLQVYGVGGTLLDSFVISASSTPNLASMQEPNNNPELAGFFGFSRAENDIVSFRIIGGPVVMDNLRFGTLQNNSDPGDPGDPGNPGDPAAIPEASTFLLCGGGLTLLAWWRRRRNS